MRISAVLHRSQLQALLRWGGTVVPIDEWKERVAAIQIQQRQNQFLEQLFKRRYSIELSFELELKRAKVVRVRWPLSDDTYKLYAFLATLRDIYTDSSEAKKRYLRQEIRKSFDAEHGLAPLAHELSVATYLSQRGWDVRFNDLENRGGFDLLLTQDGHEVEAECKFISGDKGNPIHRRPFLELVRKLTDEMEALQIKPKGGLLIDVLLSERLEPSIKAQKAIVESIVSFIQNENWR